MKTEIQRTLFLTYVRQYCVDFMVEQGWASNGIDVQEQWLLDTAMRAIRITFKYPAVEVQKEKEIARYPATLWSHVLDAVGLKKYATYKRVLLNEHLAFPSVEIPPEMKIGMRVCHDYHTAVGPWEESR